VRDVLAVLAIRRCGELLAQVKAQRGGDRRSMGRQRPVGREAAAGAAGLSERQRKVALRVASIPPAKFEREVAARSGLLRRLASPCRTAGREPVGGRSWAWI
jgi:hypothetical protein